MDLSLTAYKPAQNFTLAERAERMLKQQRFISEELNNWIWYLHDKTAIDLRDDACYELIYKQAKRGMNTKMAKITKYQPNDIPDLQSRCDFYKSTDFSPDPFLVSHHLGYNRDYSEKEYIRIDHFYRAPELNNELTIRHLVSKIIQEYDPVGLYVASKKFILEFLNVPHGVPWSGWITYLNKSVRLPDLMPKFCQVEHLTNGVLFNTNDNMFDEDNPQHIDTALKLSKWIEKNKVRV